MVQLAKCLTFKFTLSNLLFYGQIIKQLHFYHLNVRPWSLVQLYDPTKLEVKALWGPLLATEKNWPDIDRKFPFI